MFLFEMSLLKKTIVPKYVNDFTVVSSLTTVNERLPLEVVRAPLLPVPLIVFSFVLPQGHSICHHTLLVLCRGDLKLVCSGPFLSSTLATVRLLVLHILLVSSTDKG